MRTAVDSNIFMDLIAGTEAEATLSEGALRRARVEGQIAISMIAYAELASRFQQKSSLDAFLKAFDCHVERTTDDSAYQAGRLFQAYRKRGGERSRILADFLIAGHALEHADRLLTRDRGFYGTSFPKLKVIQPKNFQ